MKSISGQTNGPISAALQKHEKEGARLLGFLTFVAVTSDGEYQPVQHAENAMRALFEEAGVGLPTMKSQEELLSHVRAHAEGRGGILEKVSDHLEQHPIPDAVIKAAEKAAAPEVTPASAPAAIVDGMEPTSRGQAARLVGSNQSGGVSSGAAQRGNAALQFMRAHGFGAGSLPQEK